MAKKKPATPPVAPQVFEAVSGANGSVARGGSITQSQAEGLRRTGQDVVVCGPDLRPNRDLPAQSREMRTAAPNVARRMRVPALWRCHIFNLIPGLRRDIHSMKHPIEKPSDRIMRFFTPELYVQFNSADDDVADRANEAWEKALEAYRIHLAGIRDRMPTHVRNVSELCLHDAEVLGFEQESQACFPFPEPLGTTPHWSALAIVSLKQDDTIRSLYYVLWDRVRQYPPPKNWPFSKLQKHWLYDEMDVTANQRALLLHRVLFSDGSIAEIPFISVVASSVTLPSGNENRVAKRIA
jgi:hypothetical protein